MKIIVRNITTSPAACFDLICAAGATLELTGRKPEEAIALLVSQGSTFDISSELESDDIPHYVCAMKNPGDATGGATTRAGVGLDATTLVGAALSADVNVTVAIFDDEDCTVPAVNAEITSAQTGTIVSGTDTNKAVVTTSSGEISLTITDTEDETVYIKAWQGATTFLLSCGTPDSVTFSA